MDLADVVVPVALRASGLWLYSIEYVWYSVYDLYAFLPLLKVRPKSL
jgi:hypothetical protein